MPALWTCDCQPFDRSCIGFRETRIAQSPFARRDRSAARCAALCYRRPFGARAAQGPSPFRSPRLSAAIDAALCARGWEERKFDTAVIVDEQQYPSPTHGVDCYKNKIALEIEWNNKDPFFDRDLNNFRLLFELRVVSVGIIVTRCDELQEIFHSLGRGSSYGMSTTNMSKLLPKIEGGGAGGCPVILFGIRASLYDPTS
ncbi:MAG: BglII/BstYI family type II restriction endonuclease [Vulcanimicrobiaceae bacterium]